MNNSVTNSVLTNRTTWLIIELGQHSDVTLQKPNRLQYAIGATECLAAAVTYPDGVFIYKALWGDAVNTAPLIAPTVEPKETTVNTTKLSLTQPPPKKQVEFALPEGVSYVALGQYEYHHLGQYIGEAGTYALADEFYHEFLQTNYDHLRRNPANAIPFCGEPVPPAEAGTEWQEYGLEAQ